MERETKIEICVLYIMMTYDMTFSYLVIVKFYDIAFFIFV